MTMPAYWRRATFSVAETAEMIGSTEEALRTWIARCPLGEFCGEKTHGRLWLSGRDGYFYRLVWVLTTFGVPVRTAMYTAGGIADFGPPHFDYLIVERKDGVTTFQSTNDPDNIGPALIMPLRDLYDQHLELCAEANVREAS